MFRYKDSSNNDVVQTWEPFAQTAANRPFYNEREWELIALELAKFVAKSATIYWGRSPDYVFADIRKGMKRECE